MSASGVWWGGETGVSGLESGLLIWVLCPSRQGSGAVKAGGVVLALRAQGVSAASGVVGMWRASDEARDRGLVLGFADCWLSFRSLVLEFRGMQLVFH